MIDGKPVRREVVEGQPVLLAIDIQGGDRQAIPMIEGYAQRMRAAATVIAKARACRIPVVFSHEVHRADMVDFGRELDGTEAVHLLKALRARRLMQSLWSCCLRIMLSSSCVTHASLVPIWRYC